MLAEISSYAQIAGPDATLHERPAEALRVALKRASLGVTDLDLVEINEAFASVALWSSQMLEVDRCVVFGIMVRLEEHLVEQSNCRCKSSLSLYQIPYFLNHF